MPVFNFRTLGPNGLRKNVTLEICEVNWLNLIALQAHSPTALHTSEQLRHDGCEMASLHF